MARKLSTPMAILVVVGLVALVVTIAVVASNLRAKARMERVDATLEAAIAATKEGRAERPVLRGEPIDSNAWEAQRKAVAALAPDKAALAQFGELLKAPEPMPPELLALAAAKSSDLTSLRDAARRSWTWNGTDVAQGFGAPVPDYPVHIAATKLLILLGEQASGEECLRINADALRLSHDRLPGGGLLPTMVSSAETRMFARSVIRCASRASSAERAAAGAEFARLLETRPSLGEALDLEAIALASELRKQSKASISFSSVANRPAMLIERALAVSATEHLVGEIGQWTEALKSGPPESIACAKSLADARLKADSYLLEMSTPNIEKYVDKDVEAIALLRGLVLALDAIDTVPPRAPARIADTAFADPFTGRPFILHPPVDGAAALLCSVGSDHVDDHGAEASDDVCLELR